MYPITICDTPHLSAIVIYSRVVYQELTSFSVLKCGLLRINTNQSMQFYAAKVTTSLHSCLVSQLDGSKSTFKE